MAEIFSLFKLMVGCASVVFIVTIILLALPKSRLRAISLEVMKWVLAFGLFVLVPSPIDLAPDIAPPFTYLDDLGYAAAGVASIRSAINDRRKRIAAEATEGDTES